MKNKLNPIDTGSAALDEVHMYRPFVPLPISDDIAQVVRDYRQLTAERDELKAECERLREGLIKLRDCDFVITPADRMDAVRKIARDTLNKENTDD